MTSMRLPRTALYVFALSACGARHTASPSSNLGRLPAAPVQSATAPSAPLALLRPTRAAGVPTTPACRVVHTGSLGRRHAYGSLGNLRVAANAEGALVTWQQLDDPEVGDASQVGGSTRRRRGTLCELLRMRRVRWRRHKGAAPIGADAILRWLLTGDRVAFSRHPELSGQTLRRRRCVHQRGITWLRNVSPRQRAARSVARRERQEGRRAVSRRARNRCWRTRRRLRGPTRIYVVGCASVCPRSLQAVYCTSWKRGNTLDARARRRARVRERLRARVESRGRPARTRLDER